MLFKKSSSFVSESRIIKAWTRSRVPLALFPLYGLEYARARLTAFRSDREWITAFEFIVFNTTSGEGENWVETFGNRVKRKNYYHVLSSLNSTKDSPYYPIFDTDEKNMTIIDLHDFEVDLRGEPRRFTISPEEYERIGINPTERKSDPLTKILRYLSYTTPDDVFLSDDELLKLIGRSANIPKFIQTFDWYHPDSRKDEGPSDSPCLRSLARAISENDPELYECPDHLINTHWSHWPEWCDHLEEMRQQHKDEASC
jgi:hypothetical protein